MSLFNRSAAHLDITFHKIKGKEWITLGMHVFDPFLKVMVTLGIMDFEDADIMSVEMIVLFFELVDIAVLKHCKSSSRSISITFDPTWFISDGQGNIWKGIRKHYGDGTEASMEGREQTCGFHFEQGVVRLTDVIKQQGFEKDALEIKELVRKMVNNTILDECYKDYQR